MLQVRCAERSVVGVEARSDAICSRSDWRARLACRLWGHHVDNRAFRERTSAKRSCRCGQPYLATDGSHTRVRHTLSCFLGHHTYVRMTDRDAHHEYACMQCGHPLMFAADHDPYAAVGEFKKKVRYVCGLVGHHVHRVTSREGFVEYACHCGHSFLKEDGPIDVIRHPLICVAAGHYVRYVASRAGYSEYVCRNCGHPFCFAEAEFGDAKSHLDGRMRSRLRPPTR